MATIIERFQPSFVRWPIQNARTALKPVNIPLILVVPFVRRGDASLNGSQISNLRYFIEDAPGRARVAGFKNKGIFIPQLERFIIKISRAQLLDVKIDLEGQKFLDKDTGLEKDFVDAVEGDLFEYTLERGLLDGPGARDTIEFFPDADYYDLSIFVIDTAELKPFGRYNFVWQADYNTRLVTPDNELLCIDEDNKAVARFELEHAHPGEVHLAWIENTPTVYFSGDALEDDTYVEFVRPLADLLQDVYDEQSLIEGINFVNDIPSQLIPYLAFLVGLELPYFPGATDSIRRNILRNARRLQQLKGSRRALIELFEIFGFVIQVDNLWNSPDGSRLVKAGEDPIELIEVCQTEPILSEFDTNGFGQLDIPLLFKPNGNITIDAFFIKSDSADAAKLRDLANSVEINPIAISETCPTDPQGFLLSPAFDSVSGPFIGWSQVLVDSDSGISIDDKLVNEAPISRTSIRYDKDTNILSVTFDHYLQFQDSLLFVFATYNRDDINLPNSFRDLISNRFDIEILFKTGEQPTSQLYEFLLDFLLKFKAFHSLLRKIILTITNSEVYNVIDFCVGGINKQEPGTDAGELQTPPAVIPGDPDICDDDRGFSKETLQLRSDILAGLEAEHEAWKNLDGTHEIQNNLQPILESLQRLQIPPRDDSPCEFTPLGQDRIITDDFEKDFDHVEDDREKLCSLEGNTQDYCYKGRVGQDLIEDRVLSLTELSRCKSCILMMGQGVYYTAPLQDTAIGTFATDRCERSSIGTSLQNTLYARVKSYEGATLHYSDRVGFSPDLLTNDFFAIRRPSLDIEKDNLFFPGHRFISMNKLKDDVLSPSYSFRPWDSIFHRCPEDIDPDMPTLDDLDPRITTGSDPDEEFLEFNDIQLKYFGNNLEPDISSLGFHEDRDFTVTHAIYSSADPHDSTAGSAITFDTVVFTDAEAICLDNSLGPIFESANRQCDFCPDDAIGDTTNIEAVDFVDGYPAETGRFDALADDSDFPRGTTEDVDLHTLLGLPSPETGTSLDLLFKLGSGVLVEKDDTRFEHYKPFRLDCGCLFFEDCETTDSTEGPARLNRCQIDLFIDSDGHVDPHCDRVALDRTMILNEEFGTCSFVLDATIGNMLCFNDDLIALKLDDKLPPEGTFKIVDGYGIIYEGMFEVSGDRIDITTTKYDPRVWGEPSSGFIGEDRRVFRRGIVTICRSILEITDDGYIILAEGCEQKIDTFQSNFVCGDVFPSDPFAFHLNCGITDDVELETVEVTG